MRRRWYPWRRAFSVRDFLTTAESTPQAAENVPESADEPAERTPPTLPKNVIAKVLFLLVGVVVWVVMAVGKALFYVAVIALFLLASLVEWMAALLVMPVALLLRLCGVSKWPVEIGSAGKHFTTERADDYAAAGALRDRLSADIVAGRPPPRAVESAE